MLRLHLQGRRVKKQTARSSSQPPPEIAINPSRPARPHKAPEDPRRPWGEERPHPPMSPVNYDLWREGGREGGTGKDTAVDEGLALWSHRRIPSELHNFLKSDSLWTNPEGDQGQR